MTQFHRLGAAYLESRVRAQRLVATYFPFVQFLSSGADAIVLGVGAGLVVSGYLTSGALIAFILYIDLFFSPIQQLSQVFDAWQQTRVSVRRIADLMALETGTPSPAEPSRPGHLRGEISLRNVRFTYPAVAIRPGMGSARRGERRGPADARSLQSADAESTRTPEALQGIDLHIAAGQTVALVGDRRLSAPHRRARPVTVVGAAPTAGVGPSRTGGPRHSVTGRGDVQPRPAQRSPGDRRHAAPRPAPHHHRHAHRLQTARPADLIVVLGGGRVVEAGTHDELVDRGGRYASMWEAFSLQTVP